MQRPSGGDGEMVRRRFPYGASFMLAFQVRYIEEVRSDAKIKTFITFQA